MNAVREVVIAGRDAPAWLSACVLECALGPAGVEVTVVELPSLAQAADLCISLPALEALHTRLRIDESRLLAATRGVFSLGRRFVDATGDAPTFFHAHGSFGTRIDKKEFLPQWLHARRQGLVAPLEEFSLAAAAARQGRMLLPDADTDGFGFTDYAYHLPAIPYGAWLRELATRRGVRRVVTRALEVEVDAQRGITALRIDGGHEITGDFFLDATGSEALLANALGGAVESWRDQFVTDRVLTGLGALRSPVPVHSEIRAQPYGWLALAASQLGIHVQQAFCSGLTSDAEALAAAASLNLQGLAIRERHPGRRVRAWEKNCVALGEAACVFDPLHFIDLHAVQVGLVHLLHLFPVHADFAVERDEYNQNVRSAFERMRDFQSAHYVLNRYGLNRIGRAREDSAFWSRGRAAPRGEELAHKIDVFRARGEAVYYEDESFTIDDWYALFVGHGLIPETQDPAVERTSPALLKSEMQRILGFVRRKVEAQRSHAEHLRAPGR